MAGFIVGFDTEKGSVASSMVDLIEDAAIPVCMVGLLWALPTAQLTRRLEKEGRLHPNHDVSVSNEGDQCTQGLNFETLRPRRDVLRDCQEVIRLAYDPSNYFGRVRRVARVLNCSAYHAAIPTRRDLYEIVRLVWYTMIRDPDMRSEVWQTVIDCARHNPPALRAALRMTSLYLHLGPFSRYAVTALEHHIALDTSPWQRSARIVQEPLLECAAP